MSSGPTCSTSRRPWLKTERHYTSFLSRTPAWGPTFFGLSKLFLHIIFMEYSGETAVELAAMGYRRVSNKYLTVSRVDRPDWKYVLAKTHVQGLSWVAALGHDAPDMYRRCVSKDKLTVPEEVFRKVPGSGWDPKDPGYIEVQEPSLSVKREFLASLAGEADGLMAWIESLKEQADKIAPCMECRKDGFACETCGRDVFYREFEESHARAKSPAKG